MLSIAPSSLTFPTRNIASPGIVHPREVELQKAAVLLDQLPIGVEFSTLAQVADEVGVHAGVVLAAGLGVGAAYSEVDRSAELLVEEDVRARPADAVVGPDPELPKVAGPGVGLEQTKKVLLTPLRARLDNLPLLEPLLLGRLLAPIAHGVFLVETHGLESELLVLREAHVRLLRQGLRREER